MNSGQPQGQSKSNEAMLTATRAINLGNAVRNWNDKPANPIVGSSGGNPVGGQVIDAASTDITGAGAAAEAGGAAAGAADLAPLALAAL